MPQSETAAPEEQQKQLEDLGGPSRMATLRWRRGERWGRRRELATVDFCPGGAPAPLLEKQQCDYGSGRGRASVA
ncbi:hypothetical protein NDU88_005023 [Pleurodeles waltl]|uniref:Uncharacterized protein n=1 Tax=Pleurodeles waltl TaxID=8319 RepID=A0AAV7W9X9_PLEWA|nr:hypothetical protein NDU88_005023 [Pleurodeles waltl]